MFVEKAAEQRSYNKFVGKMLMKLTPSVPPNFYLIFSVPQAKKG